MIIALDYDDTYTRDLDFWNTMIAAAKSKGHTVICVTARAEKYRQEVSDALQDKVDAIICTNGRAKHPAAFQAGYLVSVWIDDAPQWVHTDALG
jgi:hydroxymethylpyrimidine pyrophosphatase-like HAD family hydrolase